MEKMRVKVWRSRIAAAAVVGAAAVTIPPTAGSASAAVTAPDGFHLADGTSTHDECQVKGWLSIEQNGDGAVDAGKWQRTDGACESGTGPGSPPEDHRPGYGPRRTGEHHTRASAA
ncbi:hypothetical protein [Streptomyces fumanus]|uniref:hypothetical protein n=1 Tax=Streptomyces fumanus TaxID=67302 RepID=UPI0033DAAFB9